MQRHLHIILQTLLGIVLLTATACQPHESEQQPAQWFVSSDTGAIDVLYLVSTDVLSARDEQGAVLYRTALSDDDRAAITGEMQWVSQHIWYGDMRMLAPYYHQFTFEALSLPADSMQALYRSVADEVCAFFDDYMAHYNGGRPFVIAGFSQGAMLCLDLLRHMSDSDYQHLVAAYMMGYRLTAEDIRHPHIRPAEDATERGVCVSYNSVQSVDAIWPLVAADAATCINPVNWTTDTTSATFVYEGMTHCVHQDTACHVLIVDCADPDYYHREMAARPFFGEAGVSDDCLHLWDLLFYGTYLHDNALMRASGEW